MNPKAMNLKMEKENIMPIVLGSCDRELLRSFCKKYGRPTVVLDTEFPFLCKIDPSLCRIKMTSREDDIVVMYVASLLEGTDRMPLLAASGEYRETVERNRERLSSMCILWHENFKF